MPGAGFASAGHARPCLAHAGFGTERAGARSPAPHCWGTVEPRDCGGTGHHRGHGKMPRQRHPDAAECERSHPGSCERSTAWYRAPLAAEPLPEADWPGIRNQRIVEYSANDFSQDSQRIPSMSQCMLTRRRFLAAAAMTAATARLRAQNTEPVTLEIPAEADGPQMPADFVGLSYEVQQLVDPNFFSKQNSGLIRALKEIAPRGVLRLGGNTSEFAWWKPTPDSPEPEHPKTREVAGEPKASYYAVTPEAVRN